MKRSITLLFLFTVGIVSLMAQTESAKPIYSIQTTRDGQSLGSFTIELFPYIAPLATKYFDSLVNIKFYDSTAFHRVVPGFVIQGGDPNSKHLPRETWGNGDPNQTNVPAEFNNIAYQRGILGAARDEDPNSANSQFFICVAPALFLNGQYTAYGRVVSGMDIVDTIVNEPRDANDNPFKKLEMFVTKVGVNDSVPEIPVLTVPADNAERITTDSLIIWSSVSGAMLYRVEIAADSLFQSMVFSGDIGTNSLRLVPVELGLKKYYWRVYANNGGHRSGYSALHSFTTAISIPELMFPEKGAVNQPGNVVLRWSAVSGAKSYRVQVSTNALFNQNGIIVDTAAIADTLFQLSGLQLNKKHYWRVAAEAATYTGAFPLQSNFTTGNVSEIQRQSEIPTEFSLAQNFPNPFNPSTTIQFSIPEQGHVLLEVFDVLGRSVAELVNKELPRGSFSVEFDAGTLSSGLYLYRMSSGQQILTRRMVIAK